MLGDSPCRRIVFCPAASGRTRIQTRIASTIRSRPRLNNMFGQQAAQVDPTQQAQFRQMQIQQAQQLQGIASGQMQGAGELAAQRQVQNALATQQAQAAMARGGQNAGLAMRNAAANSAGIGLSGAGQAQQAAPKINRPHKVSSSIARPGTAGRYWARHDECTAAAESIRPESRRADRDERQQRRRAPRP